MTQERPLPALTHCPVCQSPHAGGGGAQTVDEARSMRPAWCPWEGHEVWRLAWFRTTAPQPRPEWVDG